MRLAQKITAASLALLTAAAAAGCGSSDSSGGDAANSSVSSGKDLNESQKEQLASLADDSALATEELKNKTIKWLAHYDINPAEGATKSPGLELFETKYDGKIEWVNCEYADRYTKLATLVMSNESPDFFPADDMDTFPKGAIKAMFQPIDDYIDLDSELWKDSKNFCDDFMFNGKHYIAVIKPTPNLVCIYNTRTIEDNSLDDPAELYWKDQWTWDAFQDMCTSFTDTEAEKYGLDGYWYGNAISMTSGVPLIGMKDGIVVHNLEDPAIAKAQDFMYRLQMNNVCFDRSSNGWKTRGDGTTGEGLGSYMTLFIPTGLWAIEVPPEKSAIIGDIEDDEIMFVPMPRDPDGDKYYMSARVNGFNICTGAPNPEGVAAYLDCIQVADQKASNIYEEVLRNDYKWNDDMIAMREECYRVCAENPVFDLQNGVSSDLEAVMVNVSQATMITGGGAMSWTEAVGSYKAKVQFLIDEANNSITDVPSN
ncbi:MAG: extracellular solute-binding protein [Ruminococcus sp.]|nr:extracellular solute-binding protein [Ruminococcus sp.]